MPLATLEGQNKYAWSKSTIVEVGRTRVNSVNMLQTTRKNIWAHDIFSVNKA